MIARKMTVSEVLKELQKDDEFIVDRMPGLLIKNAKKLKSRYFQDNDILSKSTYAIPGTNDTAVVYATKFVQILKGKEYASMFLLYYIKTAYGTYIMPNKSHSATRVDSYAEFTCHSEERMKGRLRKDFDGFFQEDLRKNNGLIYPVKYEYNGDENEFVAHVGDAFLIMEMDRSRKKYVVKTVLTLDDLHVNQMKLNLESKIGGENDVKDVMNDLDSTALTYFKSMKKEGWLKPIA